MKRTFAQTFLGVGFFLFLSQCAHTSGINTLWDVDLPNSGGGSQAVPVTASIPVTSSAASVNDIEMDGESTGTGNGTSPINTGSVVNATGGTTNHAATVRGGNAGIGTSSPATGMKVDTGGPVKAPGTGNKACKASDVGAMRYNATGNYMEICSYP